MFDVDPNGKPFKIVILTSSKHDDLDQAAIKAVEKWEIVSSESGIQGKTATITFNAKKNKRSF
jgi:TonB family protein